MVAEKLNLHVRPLVDDTWTFVEWHVLNINMCNISFNKLGQWKGYPIFAVLIVKMLIGSKRMNRGLFMTCRRSLF